MNAKINQLLIRLVGMLEHISSFHTAQANIHTYTHTFSGKARPFALVEGYPDLIFFIERGRIKPTRNGYRTVYTRSVVQGGGGGESGKGYILQDQTHTHTHTTVAGDGFQSAELSVIQARHCCAYSFSGEKQQQDDAGA